MYFVSCCIIDNLQLLVELFLLRSLGPGIMRRDINTYDGVHTHDNVKGHL